MKRKKILIIISNLKIAGAQKMVEQLALAVNKEQFEVHILCISAPTNSFIEKRLLTNGIPVVFMNKAGGFHPDIIGKVGAYIRTYQPDVIHTHVTGWLYSFPTAWMMHIPILHTIHSRPNRQEENPYLRKLINWLYHRKRIVPVAISDEIRKETIEFYHLPENQVEMVYNPVDYATFSRVEKIPHDNIVFVNVARFNKVKNQLFLIRVFSKALQQQDNLQLMLAGEGELQEQAKQLVQELEIQEHVTFLGNVDDVPELFSRCDVFILPSTTEGLPISMLEAEAAALPVIASNIGGIPDILRDNGVLVPVNDEQALLTAILAMTDRKLRETCALKSRRIAAEYSAENAAKKYEALYEKYGK